MTQIMTRQTTRNATLLIMALFALQPMAFGAWLAMIPYIKTTLDLSKSELSLALLGMPLALVPTMPFASRMVTRFGPRRSFAVLLPVQVLVILLPFGAWSMGSLFVALACLGVIVAFLEVALNTYAGRLEKAADIMIMARCHGCWALGVAAGSLMAAMLFGLGPVVAVFLLCSVTGGIGVVAGRSLPRLTGEDDGKMVPRRKLRDTPKVLLLIAMFVMVVTIVEGAMSDWAAVFLAERWGGGPEEAGIVVTVFATFLAAGRFTGDWLKRRLGARGVARFTLTFATAGLMILTIPTGVPYVFIGVALIGVGVSIGFPLGVSAAAGLDNTYEAQNIATMSMIAISGFLVGPPLIGFVAEAFSLRAALMGLLPLLLIALMLTRIFPGRESPPRGRESRSESSDSAPFRG